MSEWLTRFLNREELIALIGEMNREADAMVTRMRGLEHEVRISGKLRERACEISNKIAKATQGAKEVDLEALKAGMDAIKWIRDGGNNPPEKPGIGAMMVAIDEALNVLKLIQRVREIKL
jgi:hypothetical protein